MNSTTRVVLALVAGLAIGVAGAAWNAAAMSSIAAVVEPIGVLWTNAVRMTVIPLVVGLIISGIAQVADGRRLGRVGARALPVFLGLLIASGLFAVLVAPLSIDRMDLPPDVAAGLRESVASDTGTVRRIPSLTQRIIEIVPANPFQAAADGALLPLVVFSLIFGVALTRLAPDRRAPVVGFFQAVADAMLVVVRWVLVVAPVAIFALSLGLGARMGAAAAGALVHYMITLSAVLFAFILLVYPFAVFVGRVGWRRFALAAAPAQAIALSTRSSLAALPVMVTSARDHLAAGPPVTAFALPLAVSVFRLNVPIGWVVGALFLGKLYGVELDAGQLVGLVLTATLISFSVPGIPSGSLFLVAPVLVQLGLPAEGVGILIALDAVPDMFKTALNVTGHMATAAVLSSPPGSSSPLPKGEGTEG